MNTDDNNSDNKKTGLEKYGYRSLLRERERAASKESKGLRERRLERQKAKREKVEEVDTIKEGGIVIIGDSFFKQAVLMNLLEIVRVEEGYQLISFLATNDKHTVIFPDKKKEKKENNHTRYIRDKNRKFFAGVRFYSDLRGKLEKDKVQRYPFVTLGHELVHARQFLEGEVSEVPIIISNDPFDNEGGLNYLDAREIEAVDFENILRSAHGYAIRRAYDGTDAAMSLYEKVFRSPYHS